MDILTTTTLLGLNPDVEKSKFLNETSLENLTENGMFFDLKKTYFFVNNQQSKIDYLKDYIATFLNDVTKDDVISLNVVNNTFSFLDKLNLTIINELDLDDIYTTSYGTVVFDCQNRNNNSVFSLEIGKKEFGYFIEKDGIDIKQVDAIEIEKVNEELITNLINFFE
mgnify:CR=1 FL=1|tara:strand:- start:659 stop:1159 length:501 start_codon:yes stop_codon:yes gene_type:complete